MQTMERKGLTYHLPSTPHMSVRSECKTNLWEFSPQQRRYSLALWDSPQKQFLSRYPKRRDPTGKPHSLAYSWRRSLLVIREWKHQFPRYIQPGFTLGLLESHFFPVYLCSSPTSDSPAGLVKTQIADFPPLPSPTTPRSCSSRSGVGPKYSICYKLLAMLLVWELHSENSGPTCRLCTGSHCG